MAFSRDIKSNRLLQSRRFTQDRLGDAQEAFTRVLDLNASEIYTQQTLIPTGSLPYSASSQNGLIVTVNNQPVLRYWYRQRLTPSNTLNTGETSYNTWFFLDPTSSVQLTNGVNPGTLLSTQQGNFISPKYAPTLGGNTEDSTPGYQVRLTSGSSIVDPATYTFDYKTGVVQFVSQSGYTSITTDIRLTAYQYIGRTLESDTLLGYTGSLFGTASWATNALTASYINPENIVIPSPFYIATGSVTASVDVIASSIFLIKSGSRSLFNVDNSGNTTTSGSLTLNTTGSYTSLVSVKNNGTEYFKINGEGVLVLTQFATPPTAVSGGIYSDTSGNFYFGI